MMKTMRVQTRLAVARVSGLALNLAACQCGIEFYDQTRKPDDVVKVK
jgi:hypothetical protein